MWFCRLKSQMTGKPTGCSVYLRHLEIPAHFYIWRSPCEWVGSVGKNSRRTEISLDNLALEVKTLAIRNLIQQRPGGFSFWISIYAAHTLFLPLLKVCFVISKIHKKDLLQICFARFLIIDMSTWTVYILIRPLWSLRTFGLQWFSLLLPYAQN